ncbi:galactitol-1-phosphate 5-dehydrogenase [Lactobacillus sp. M0398]|uniref:galactitol-1-phosphate 5-dehydrogenase n=1 Tax=unclassified Lactobacillus TaxID=2620435 RepID=UPI0018DD273B|nr:MULTISPECIES: galactitol-1-phosphate 5-dehydrogenase [unclassified Lactobacillus]MBI0120968.1 galactitol-1-phosphate 5-dehydrogenase [Lactobacillus sp. M0398]MBI0123115.1 galactitol-1-phosphate 5-dehydrogenase [Lactobacillus sp. W8174]MBI0135283.1 galactitol-1-phosphate 5-dehydrogenase [Lactobacillus sp. W8173]
MKALVITAKNKMELQDIPVPELKNDQVLIHVAYAGICGSDLPRYYEGKVHHFPQIPGHEFSGTVEKIGSDVKGLNIGDKVSVAPLIPCGKCDECKAGFPSMCTNYTFIGSSVPGALAEYVAVPAQNCLVLPDNVSLKEAATVEPLTVAIHGIERVNIKAGANVLVLGVGSVGLLAVMALKARGAGKITVVDIKDSSLKVAQECGADIVINSAKINLSEYFKTHSLFDAVFETAGNPITQVQAIKYAGKHAKVVFIGKTTRPTTFQYQEFEQILRKELEITGSWLSFSAPFPGYEWHAAIDYLSSGRINTQRLITGTYKLEDKDKPFAVLSDKNSGAIKVMYKIS